MRRGWLVVFILTFGCRRDLTPEMDKLIERACSCTDSVCAEKVIADLVAFKRTNKNARTTGETGARRVEAMGKRFGECVRNAGVGDEALARLQAELTNDD
jgi:hypothetical protein